MFGFRFCMYVSIVVVVGFASSASDACSVRRSGCFRATARWFSRQGVRVWSYDRHVCTAADFCLNFTVSLWSEQKTKPKNEMTPPHDSRMKCCCCMYSLCNTFVFSEVVLVGFKCKFWRWLVALVGMK